MFLPALTSFSRLTDLMRSSITCLASILSSNFLRLSTVPVEDVEVLVAEEDDDEPVAWPVPATPMTLPAVLGRSVDPVSLNPDPLLGFLCIIEQGRPWKSQQVKSLKHNWSLDGDVKDTWNVLNYFHAGMEGWRRQQWLAEWENGAERQKVKEISRLLDQAAAAVQWATDWWASYYCA